MSDRVTCTITDGVADVRLNRPDKLNALDLDMFDALVEMGEALKANRSVRAVVLSGEGRAFCAGLDLGLFQVMADGSWEGDNAGRAGRSAADLLDRKGRITNHGQQAVYAWTEMPAPVIAAVHGHALGGGLQLALGADIRIVAPDAKMSVLEIRWGLVPDMTGTQMLPRLVGLDVAKELTFTGRTVTGEEAVAIGLATRLSQQPREDALVLAKQIAASSPEAIKGAKTLLSMAGLVSLDEGFAAEERINVGLIGSANQVEAVMAYVEKRPASFKE